MDKQLSVKIVQSSNCIIQAVDITDYSSIGADLSEHVMFDILSYTDDVIQSAYKIYEVIPGQPIYAELPLDSDGLFYYYKLAIPKLEHFRNGALYEGLSEQLFVYNSELYFCSIPDMGLHSVDEILETSVVVNNYVNAYYITHDNEASQTFYFPKTAIFTYCHLQECLVKLQKQLLLSTGFNPCSFGSVNKRLGSNCNTNVDLNLKGTVDFLLTALYVLDYLADNGKFEEAQQIIESLATCGNLCDNITNTKTGCGCGKTI